jgi:hypothetical protein
MIRRPAITQWARSVARPTEKQIEPDLVALSGAARSDGQ